MDEIKQRLKDASDACITTYEAWRAKSSDASAREALQEAVHELRKVSARLEIELAVSDRKTQGNEPIPIPSHRASRPLARGGQDFDGDDDNRANRQQPGNRGERDGNRSDGSRRPVQIRPRSEGAAAPASPAAAASGNEAAPAPGNDAPAAAAGGEEEGARKRPLSLKRGNPDNE